MSYQEDFVLRLARRIGEVLARALGIAKRGSFDESHQILEQGVASELGMPFHMLLRLDAASALRLLGKDKAVQLVEASRTRALLFELGGRHSDAQASRDHAETLEALIAGLGRR